MVADGTHRQIAVKVNAEVDEDIAELVGALSSVPGVFTLESCQGHPGERDAFVVFYMDSWQACGDLLFEKLLPLMPPDLRSDVSLRLEAYDTRVARAWITLDPNASEPLCKCIRQLASASIGQRVLVTGDAHG